MKKDPHIRMVQTSVTCFLYHGDEYLFLKRSMTKRVDPGYLNGIGGRVDPGEDYLHAAIRETKEETGYNVSAEDIQLCGVVKLEGGLQEDWVMCLFKIQVKDKNIPLGNHTDDGELLWIHKDKVLDSEYKRVDDLNYCFADIVTGDKVFFMTAKLGNELKVYQTSIGKLSRC